MHSWVDKWVNVRHMNVWMEAKMAEWAEVDECTCVCMKVCMHAWVYRCVDG